MTISALPFPLPSRLPRAADPRTGTGRATNARRRAASRRAPAGGVLRLVPSGPVTPDLTVVPFVGVASVTALPSWPLASSLTPAEGPEAA